MMLGNQITKTNLSSAFPSDMFLNKESFFVSDVLVGAKKAANLSDMSRLVVGAAKRYLSIKQLPDKLYQYMTENQCKERIQF